MIDEAFNNPSKRVQYLPNFMNVFSEAQKAAYVERSSLVLKAEVQAQCQKLTEKDPSALGKYRWIKAIATHSMRDYLKAASNILKKSTRNTSIKSKNRMMND